MLVYQRVSLELLHEKLGYNVAMTHLQILLSVAPAHPNLDCDPWFPPVFHRLFRDSST